MDLKVRRLIFIAALTDSSIVLSEKAYTRWECYLAKINGQAVSVPTPRTREEMYLAYLAGKDVTIPVPLDSARMEKFLYAACGFDVVLPEPLTLEEMLWKKYIESIATKDLMDGVDTERGDISEDGTETDSTAYMRTDYINTNGITSVKVDVEIAEQSSGWALRLHVYNDNKEWMAMKLKKTIAKTTTSASYIVDITGASYIRLSYKRQAEIHVYAGGEDD